MTTKDQWELDIKAMYKDEVFMEWLEDYDTSYSCYYQGTLLMLWEAFNGGREVERNE